MPFPTPRIRHFVPLCVLLFLHRKTPSCWPPLEYLPHQFQKNAYHYDKHLISYPLQTEDPPGFTATRVRVRFLPGTRAAASFARTCARCNNPTHTPALWRA